MIQSKIIHIYSLSCPITNEVKYIGKTIQRPDYRYRSHISESKHNRRKDKAHCWIKSLLNKNLKPIMLIIEETYDINRECYWIKYYKDLGNNIKNFTDGGELGNIGKTWKISKEKLVNYKYKNNKPISQYSLDFKFIKNWESAADFSRFYNLRDNVASKSINIGSTCNGFILSFYGEEPVLKRKILNNPVLIENIETGEINEFKNTKEASLGINSNKSSVCYAIRNNTILYNKYRINIKYNDSLRIKEHKGI